MAYNEELAERIDKVLERNNTITKKKMFGGLCYLLNGNMLCGINDDNLMARVGPDNYDNALGEKYVKEMVFTGKPLKGMVYVDPDGISSNKNLNKWIDTCIAFVGTLPPKVK